MLLFSIPALLAPAGAAPLVEPQSGVRFLRAPTIDGKPTTCLGTGIHQSDSWRLYAMVFCVEEPEGREEISNYFAGPGQAHAAESGARREKALASDPSFFRFLIETPVPKAAKLVFLRKVAKQRMQDAFAEGLTRALGENEKKRIDSFTRLLDRDLQKGDVLLLRTSPSGLVRVQLGRARTLQDEKLAWAIWDFFLGQQSASPSLKESVAREVAMLGP